MEPIGSVSEGEWSCLSGIGITEEADFIAQLLNNSSSLPNDLNSNLSIEIASSYWPSHDSTANIDEASYYSSQTCTSNNMYRFLHGSSGYSLPLSTNGNYYLSHSHPTVMVSANSSMSIDLCMGNVRNSTNNSYHFDGDHDCFNQELTESNVEKYNADLLPGKNSVQVRNESVDPKPASDDKMSLLKNSKKRSRSSGDLSNTKRNVRSRKAQKADLISNTEEEGNGGLNGQSTSCCSSEDESNASQELNGGATSSSSPIEAASPSSKGKARAGRGSATDPQSLYARKRRERINERLRILQNLVPNGTKVDISTMLEEAVQYVKFLQLQIKLLSSDDMWMYAPIAYNGMDIGLNLKLNSLN